MHKVQQDVFAEEAGCGGVVTFPVLKEDFEEGENDVRREFLDG